MDRRTFCLLAGAGSTVLLGPPRLVPTRPRATGRLRFELDDARRWSLWYLGEGPPVPLIRSATLGAWVADQFLTLGDLEYSTVGIRRPPGGDALVVRGRARGVFLEAELMAGSSTPEPVATVTLTVYPDKDLPSIKGVRFFQASADLSLAGPGELLALVNGSDSNAGARLMTLPSGGEHPEVTSYGALGLTRGTRGLALAFEPDDPGEGKMKLSSEGLEALSEWTPQRPVRPDGDTSRLRLCYRPDGDGVDALRALFVPTSLVDRELLAGAPAPAGWVSAREHAGLTETEMISHAELCAQHFDRRSLQFIELGEGYQRSAGDWVTNARFPSGHRWLTDQIHSRKFRAGLWLAPFAVSEASGIPAAHPDWLVRNANDVPAVLDTRQDWGGCVYALDGAHPAARQWLFNLARRVVQEWGYDYLTLDRLRWAEAPGAHYGGLTPGDACKLGLGALRDGAGSDAFLRGCDAPLQHAVGFVNGMRIGPDAGPGWSGIQAPARAAARRSFYHRGVWLNDPDTLSVAPPLSLLEAQLWTSIVAVSGSITVLSDDLGKLDPDRLALLARALPVAAPGGRPIGAARAGTESPERPSDMWVAEGAPRWWTVVLANWDDETRQKSVPVAALGLSGTRFNAFDVWRGIPLADLTDLLTAQLEPHTCLTVAIRPAIARPQIIGTTRHVVQGAVDIADEGWNATTRTLRARTTNLDRRPYAVTIAVPKGMRPAECKADVPCSVKTLESGHVVLEWAESPMGEVSDIHWQIAFARPETTRKGLTPTRGSEPHRRRAKQR